MRIFSYAKNMLCDAYSHARWNFARALQEGGMDMERYGCYLTNDISYLQHHNRHRTIVNIQGQGAILSKSTYVAPSATLIGNVYAGKNSYFGFGAIANALTNPIRIGQNTKIGQNTVLQTAHWVPDQAFSPSLNIGNNVNIEHSCTMRSCYVDDHAHVGFRSIVMEGAQLERGCVIAPNSFVPAGSRIPQNTLWAGSPVQFVKQLGPVDQRQKQIGQQKQELRLMDN